MRSNPAEARAERTSRVPHELAACAREEIEHLRRLTLQERGRLIVVACRAAARIEQGRLENGLPPTVSAPWPASTWEFLRRNAPNARR
ncbi:MAG: hypothetical protein ACC645_24545 [Pirellulales bacterium]